MPRPKRLDRSTVADSPLTIRLTATDRAVLAEVIRLRQEELGRDAKISQGSYFRANLYKDAEARGVDVSAIAAAAEPRTAPSRKKTSR